MEVFNRILFIWSDRKVVITQERTKRLCQEYIAKVAFTEAAKLTENYDSDSSKSYSNEGGINVSENNIINDRSNASDNVLPPNDDLWIHDGKNINIMFDQYKSLVDELFLVHERLPIETYVAEFAALSHVFLLCKNQYSQTVSDVFTVDTLEKITDTLIKKDINWNLTFSQSEFMELSTTLTDLSFGLKKRQDCIIDLLMMSRNGGYSQNRVLQGIANLIQKLPTAAIKDSTTIGEAELWSTYFDPILSVLVADPEESVQFRWFNTSSPESGSDKRPDAIISNVTQLEFDLH